MSAAPNDVSYLSHARYGKAGVGVFRVVRDGKWHHVVEYNVSILVEGAIEKRCVKLIRVGAGDELLLITDIML